MRTFASLLLLAATLCACARSVPGNPTAAHRDSVQSEAGSGLKAIAGTWGGSYLCAQGETGLKLTVESSGRALFEFFPLPTNPAPSTGSYEMRATVAGDNIEFAQVRWLVQPAGYVMVDLVATEHTASKMSGSVNGSGCTSFELRRDRT